MFLLKSYTEYNFAPKNLCMFILLHHLFFLVKHKVGEMLNWDISFYEVH